MELQYLSKCLGFTLLVINSSHHEKRMDTQGEDDRVLRFSVILCLTDECRFKIKLKSSPVYGTGNSHLYRNTTRIPYQFKIWITTILSVPSLYFRHSDPRC